MIVVSPVRISALALMAADMGSAYDFGMIAAFAHCLVPEEAAELLRIEAGRSSKLRNAVLRKVVQDVEKEFLPVHRELIGHLITALAASNGRTRQGIGFSLSSLLPALPIDLKHDVYLTFLRSRYVGLRRRAYKAMAHETEPMLDRLVIAWKEFRDWECSWLLVKLLPVETLLSLKDELLPQLSEGWMVSRLFLRIAEADPAVLKELAAIDGISYCYVLAKLGRSIPVPEAKKLIRKYEDDERFGLLVWSFGQMGMWDVLIWLKGHLPSVEQSQGATLHASFSPDIS